MNAKQHEKQARGDRQQLVSSHARQALTQANSLYHGPGKVWSALLRYLLQTDGCTGLMAAVGVLEVDGQGEGRPNRLLVTAGVLRRDLLDALLQAGARNILTLP